MNKGNTFHFGYYAAEKTISEGFSAKPIHQLPTVATVEASNEDFNLRVPAIKGSFEMGGHLRD